MTRTAKELVQYWKQQRFQQIKRLYEKGSTKKELVDRFGKENVVIALAGIRR